MAIFSGNDLANEWWGTVDDDYALGGAGNDQLSGNLGHDTIFGGDGNDTLWGGHSDDPTDGNDWLDGGDGNDYLEAGPGNDSFFGGNGADKLLSAFGNDTMVGGAGNDLYIVASGLYFGMQVGGNSVIQADSDNGNDTLLLLIDQPDFATREGNDLVFHFVFGETPEQESLTLQQWFAAEPYKIRNVWYQNSGSQDEATGEIIITPQFCGRLDAGTEAGDTLNYSSNTANMFAFGLGGADFITGSEGNDYLDGGNGSDWISGGNGQDILCGGGDADQISGGNGNDLIYGGEGGDLATGDAGNDTVYGGNGDDTVEGDDGADVLYGEAGNDTLRGNYGSDWLDGGTGNDVLIGAFDADQYHFVGQFGNDTIRTYDYVNDTEDSVYFDNYLHSQVTAALSGSNLILTLYAGNTVTIQDWGLGGNHALNQFVFLDGGYSLDVNRAWIPGVNNLTGTAGNDLLTGNDQPNLLQGLGGNDTLIGGGGNDTLCGIGGGDNLYGGFGDDLLMLGDISRFQALQESLRTLVAWPG